MWGHSALRDQAALKWTTRQKGAAGVALAIMYSCTFVVVPLLISHTASALCNATSHELQRDTGGDCECPYAGAPLQNLRCFCCVRDALCTSARHTCRVIGRCCSGGGGSAADNAAWRPVQWQQQRAQRLPAWLSTLWENEYWSCC
eukprot:TRINITY_DN4274_c0_g1_i2.p3 TRINITY_DN4274_c0_g1~~TRINITY_DN4274_c0_g1_i2.p3  ORF type:complete len:145 (+),score=39.69 TRINITY_DN4274_c0_g1_i2:900-1334(+)